MLGFMINIKSIVCISYAKYISTSGDILILL